ncbi:hypothetical protein Rsub_05363 [Raphidocelis subcapitata]|uniref:HPP transmembrane region domain-containing protein n=1 Tax=Raphidocelis subcapitata TaxID=307507 RepID=A0A2V0P354_9CHLO|nr:hypothetical protein Rsub_05363 [Raphidocelis subcapitata]|eukprot:GBF92280.1 hypothetical protein Rsub_05363 [Raphidocelis subcapitata]
MTIVKDAAAAPSGSAAEPGGDTDAVLDSVGSLAQHPAAGHPQHRHPLAISSHPQHRADAVDVSVRSGRSHVSQDSKYALHIDVGEDEPPASVQEALDDAYDHPPPRPTLGHQVRCYFRKLRGGLDHRLKVPHATDLFFSWLGAFVGIAVVSLLDRALWRAAHFPLLVASFGATAVLVYGVPESKLAQPWNVIGGQVVSAIVGVLVRLALAARVPWLANALGMSLALLAQQLLTVVHPPGGATALIACSATITAPWMGFQFVLTVAVGSVVLVVVAGFVNNFCRDRSYPTFWF